MINKIKEFFRDKFYDDKEVGGSFTFYSTGRQVGDIYHILVLTESHVKYKVTFYGYGMGQAKTVSRSEFKKVVDGGEYHGRDYLFAL